MKRPIIFLMLALALCAQSCKTTKIANKTNDQSTQLIQNDITASADSSCNVTASAHTEDKSQLAQDIDETTTITEWSVPDSTGKQYPTKTTETRRTTNTKRQNNVKTTTHQETATESQTTFMDNTQTDTHNDIQTTETTKTKTSTPAWLITLIIGIIAAIVLIILVILKRYRII